MRQCLGIRGFAHPSLNRRQPAIPFGTSGSARSLTPVAAKIALPTAGARPTMGVSPAPADGRSLRSRTTISISGDVREARDAVLREMRVEDAAVLEADGLEEGAADALDDRALDLVLQVVGVDDGAALEGRDDAARCARWRVSGSTATSAQVAT